MDLFKREAEGYSVKEVDQFVRKAQQKIYDLQHSLEFYSNPTNGNELKEKEKDLLRRTVILDKIFNKLFLLVKNKLGKEETEEFLELCRELDKLTKESNTENEIMESLDSLIEENNPTGEPLIDLDQVYFPDGNLDEMCKELNLTQTDKKTK